MIEVKEYIKGQLKILANKFSAIHIIYGYNEYAETHIVQLTPQSEYYGNDALDNTWLDIVKDFQIKFPFENISFVSDDLELVTAPEFEFNIPMNNPSEIWSELIDTIFYELVKYKPSFELEFTVGISESQKCTFSNSGLVVIGNIISNSNEMTEISNAGEYSYAMAA